jgi:NAD(P)-dependent dehydrogenase (short-subunit alcohol dehydrogenase family)
MRSIALNIYKFVCNNICNYRKRKGPNTKNCNKQRNMNDYKLITQDIIYDMIIKEFANTNNVVTRQLQNSCTDLYEFDQLTLLNKKSIKLKSHEIFRCYGCQRYFRSAHSVYVFSCVECGNMFQKFRHFSRDLTGKVAFVTGSRTKLGHQITLKLLRAGCKVIGTTRYPLKALKTYETYKDYDAFKENLNIYPEALDFDTPNMTDSFNKLAEFIKEKFGQLNILVNCAAQTIRAREKLEYNQPHINPIETNRYNDSKHVDSSCVNSWQMTLSDLIQNEMEEVYRVNAIAPCLLVQSLLELMKMSEEPPYIINVHAREGLLNVKKSKFHMHLNMAKSAMSMFTRCLASSKLKTNNNEYFRIHGVDPGWISVDEYYEDNCPWIVPPLDEIDGAARILYPLFKNLSTCSKTRRHFCNIVS